MTSLEESTWQLDLSTWSTLPGSPWVVIEATGCNCGGGGEWPHEDFCGFEPLFETLNPELAKQLAADHNALVEEVKRLSQDRCDWDCDGCHAGDEDEGIDVGYGHG